MSIQSSRFGTIEIDHNQIITIPSGLLGFSNERHFVLLRNEEDAPFEWFHSVDNPELAFVVIEPNLAVSDYGASLSAEHLRKLEANTVEEVEVRCIITMARELKNVTVNLQGPLLLNLEKKVGLQMVIPDGKYTTRHLLFGDKMQLDEGHSEQDSHQKAAAAN